jgi:hypothetical protein
VPLKHGERIMGLEAQRTMVLPAPYVFALSDDERSVPIRAIRLPDGANWAWSLPVTAQELRDARSLPLPAVAVDCMALAYQAPRTGGGPGSETTVLLLDMKGRKLDTLNLPGNFTRAKGLELRGLGESLFVLGRGATPGGACLEILEPQR